MPAKPKLSQAVLPAVATKKTTVVVEDYSIGSKWVDGGVEWEIEATVEDGGVTAIRMTGTAVSNQRPIGDTPDYDTSKLKALLKRLYENDGRV